MSECIYGPPHWEGDFVDKPTEYYRFLAGFVRTQRLTSILDLGTHFGGSVMSMSEGICSPDISKSYLATVDVSSLNEVGFRKYPHIKRVKGDVLSKHVVREITKFFGKKIDLIYIDTTHKYAHVKAVISVYANRLKPKYIILDDITLNNSMKKLWREIEAEFKDNAFDAALLGARGKEVGFGVIAWNNVFKGRWKLIEIFYWNMYFIKQLLKHTTKSIIKLRRNGSASELSDVK